jgi:hypothetical protein
MSRELSMDIPIKVTREPFSKLGSWSSRQEYRGTLSVEDGYGTGRWIAISFCTNPEGRRKPFFYSAICPGDFKDLARMMMKAAPVEAIKAFGLAMQEVSEASTCIP